MSNLYFRLEALPGSDIDRCSAEAAAIAGRLGVGVVFRFNGHEVRVNPGDCAHEGAERYRRACEEEAAAKRERRAAR